MSDTVRCDKCRKIGYRKRFFLAPTNWLYIETLVDEEEDCVITYACSEECAHGLWQKGPGPRQTIADTPSGPTFIPAVRVKPENVRPLVPAKPITFDAELEIQPRLSREKALAWAKEGEEAPEGPLAWGTIDGDES